MGFIRPIFVTGVALSIAVFLPIAGLAAQVEVIGSFRMAPIGEFLILKHGQGSAEVSCGAGAAGNFEISIIAKRKDEYDAGSVVHVARHFRSKRDCEAYKRKLLAASPRHPVRLKLASVALRNNEQQLSKL